MSDLVIKAGAARTMLSQETAAGAATLNVVDASAFPSAGFAQLDSPDGIVPGAIIAYTGKTATSFTGCTWGSTTWSPQGMWLTELSEIVTREAFDELQRKYDELDGRIHSLSLKAQEAV